jgi:hypothetical protein
MKQQTMNLVANNIDPASVDGALPTRQRANACPDELTHALLMGRAQFDEVGCLVWHGAIARGCDPQMRMAGKQHSVRRLVWVALHGYCVAGHQVAALPGCDVCCVHPDHLQSRERRLANANLKMPAMHRMNTIRGKQAAAKIGWDDVRAMRGSDESNAAVALRLGISKQYVSQIRNNHTWVDLASPWGGLLLQAAGQRNAERSPAERVRRVKAASRVRLRAKTNDKARAAYVTRAHYGYDAAMGVVA